MAALLGASDEDVEALCLEAGEVWPANYNCPGQVVASGLHRGVDRLMDLARARGIKAKLLDVDGAFHSSVMAPAAEKLRESLSGVKINTPSLPFLSATSPRSRRASGCAPCSPSSSRRRCASRRRSGWRSTTASTASSSSGTAACSWGWCAASSPGVEAVNLGDPSDLPALLALAGRSPG